MIFFSSNSRSTAPTPSRSNPVTARPYVSSATWRVVVSSSSFEKLAVSPITVITTRICNEPSPAACAASIVARIASPATLYGTRPSPGPSPLTASLRHVERDDGDLLHVMADGDLLHVERHAAQYDSPCI